MEAKTPKFQKTFTIHVPTKYKLGCDDETHKRFQITPIPPSLIISRQSDYLSEVKGPLVECDLLAISSTMICLSKNNGSLEYYAIGDYAYQDEVETEEKETVDLGDVERIVRDATEVMKKFDVEVEQPKKDKVLTSDDLEHLKVVTPKATDDQIELEFEDQEGESVDAIPLMDVIGEEEEEGEAEAEVALVLERAGSS